MIKILKLQSVTDVVLKESEDNREYVRVSFDTIDSNNVNVKSKISMSENQWKDLKNIMQITFNNELEEITTKNPISVEFDENGMTKSNSPKPLIEQKTGKFKGNSYNYFELNVGILIENNIVAKEKFQKDYGKLF